MATWEDVVVAGNALPGVELSTSYGAPALKVHGRGMCRLREADPAVLAIRVADMGEREALLQSGDDAFFTIPHYEGHPYVLVRLDLVDPAELCELVEEAWRIRAPKRIVRAFDTR